MTHLRSVCVYAGSSVGARPAYAEAAALLGRTLAERGVRIVYGGGAVGLMGILADAAIEAGGVVVGVIPQALQDREIGHEGLTELRIVGSMHERKLTMAELADAFIALPGGIGTVEELVEAMTWTQLGIHDKPCALLEVEGYYAPFIAFVDHAVAEGFVPQSNRGLLLSSGDVAALLDDLEGWSMPPRRRWVVADEA
ncbi:LOG family protein [Capillimicrobium parvum]|uniref:Cytokinin riboside 5'-monophosphate phosphoribohydrolase n=1 Tax=Capillimicrobium parvum TaxID=2884022 RepID=A0A9E6XW14_9ACTN|nr:TIGR00730 family Rossman fold protein [Capillimicrobium parvum]UGS35471.1 Putative cytokinin riboside 5'-monophosphate phosphoribohydrolase [Capillimicrobium parvum]